MPQLNVLISGAGIAGSVAAYWLGKAGVNVTVIERAPAFRKSGQGIDVRGRGIDVVRKMGVEEEIRSRTTKEEGLIFVDENNNDLATLGVDAESDESFTADIEITRYDLTKILYDAALSTNNVKCDFDMEITSLSQTGAKVTVDLSNGETQQYDLVIAADGFGSKTRNLILGPEKSKSGIKSLDLFTAYFSIPHEDQDAPRSRWFMTTQRRAATLRPRDQRQTSAYLTVITKSQAIRDAQASGDIQRQKAVLTETFSDVGWQVPRILKEMQNLGPDDFYFQEVGQIKLDTAWHQGRCALVGDAAYCPSPLTGMGTTLAIIGAYVLAGEIVAQVKSCSCGPGPGPGSDSSSGSGSQQQPSTPDFELAFQNYEDKLGDYVRDIQKLPLNGAIVWILNPETAWALWLLRTFLWFVDRSGLTKLGSWFGGLGADKFQLPQYDF